MNRRINTISEMIMKGVILADIGTDHAFLPIMAVRNGTAVKAYACDISEGPLKTARANIAAEGLQDRIITVLGSGFDNVPEDADCAVIAGMGYHTAAGILEKAAGRLPAMKQIIVEINKDTELIRQWISERGYTITDERVVREKGFDYVIVSFNTEKHEPYSAYEIECGPVLLQRKDEEFRQFSQRRAEKISSILRLCRSDDPRRAMLMQKLAYWQQAERECMK